MALLMCCEHPNKEGCRLWAEAVEPKSLDEMSKDELRAACKDIGVSQAGSKDEMIARIRAKLDEAPEINAEDVPE